MRFRRLAGLVFPLCLAAAPLRAGTITFEPAQPTTKDVFRVIFHEEAWFTVCPPPLHRVSVKDGRVVLRAEPTGCILLLVHNPYTIDVDVGPLPAGTYSVVVETVDSDYRRVTETSEVTVVSAGGAPEPPPAALGCVHGSRPGATLLLPYFEVDLEDPEGRDTLFSVNNASEEAVVAHVAVWTNWGIPVFSFDMAIDGDGVRALSLRDVLVDGKLPATSLPPADEARFAGCRGSLAPPVVGQSLLRRVRDRLTGHPDPPELCYSSAVEDGRVATGFVTVDAVHRCSSNFLAHPLDDGYFSDGGEGVASDANVLWGDFYLIDASQDYAQGLELVAVEADAERFGAKTTTFYPQPESHRAPLGNRYRTRFLQGGPFDGGTDLLVWTASFKTAVDNCDSPATEIFLGARFRNEAGAFDSEFELYHLNRAARLRVGEEPWPVGSPFGTADLSFGVLGGLTEPLPLAAQGLVIPILSAAGRYSVGLNATQLDGFCP